MVNFINPHGNGYATDKTADSMGPGGVAPVNIQDPVR
jgi:hypothetical protein